jgi:hypothetical protein
MATPFGSCCAVVNASSSCVEPLTAANGRV